MSDKKAPVIKVDDALVIMPLSAQHIDEITEIENLSFTVPWSKEAYLKELNENIFSFYLGVFWQERLVAYGGYWLIMDEAHISNIAVHPLFRGQGLGELLMRNIIVSSLSQGSTKMTLEVRESNSCAQNLYQKLGFVASGIRPGYYSDNNEGAVIMWLDLRTYT
ncbi:MAG: ribosomal protein S18-alanine N-acetyltransferase [Bacillota bacterium]|jgi:ribosomal-protein-alanine N-acetyltransferase